MPYIITTYIDVHGDGLSVDRTGRTAVATLDEARDIVAEDLCHFDFDAFPDHPLADHIPTIPESGGTIGPLPDGTVIEVRHLIWSDLADEADCFPVPWSHEKIIAAFNAA